MVAAGRSELEKGDSRPPSFVRPIDCPELTTLPEFFSEGWVCQEFMYQSGPNQGKTYRRFTSPAGRKQILTLSLAVKQDAKERGADPDEAAQRWETHQKHKEQLREQERKLDIEAAVAAFRARYGALTGHVASALKGWKARPRPHSGFVGPDEKNYLVLEDIEALFGKRLRRGEAGIPEVEDARKLVKSGELMFRVKPKGQRSSKSDAGGVPAPLAPDAARQGEQPAESSPSGFKRLRRSSKTTGSSPCQSGAKELKSPEADGAAADVVVVADAEAGAATPAAVPLEGPSKRRRMRKTAEQSDGGGKSDGGNKVDDASVAGTAEELQVFEGAAEGPAQPARPPKTPELQQAKGCKGSGGCDSGGVPDVSVDTAEQPLQPARPPKTAQKQQAKKPKGRSGCDSGGVPGDSEVVAVEPTHSARPPRATRLQQAKTTTGSSGCNGGAVPEVSEAAAEGTTQSAQPPKAAQPQRAKKSEGSDGCDGGGVPEVSEAAVEGLTQPAQPPTAAKRQQARKTKGSSGCDGGGVPEVSEGAAEGPAQSAKPPKAAQPQQAKQPKGSSGCDSSAVPEVSEEVVEEPAQPARPPKTPQPQQAKKSKGSGGCDGGGVSEAAADATMQPTRPSKTAQPRQTKNPKGGSGCDSGGVAKVSEEAAEGPTRTVQPPKAARLQQEAKNPKGSGDCDTDGDGAPEVSQAAAEGPAQPAPPPKAAQPQPAKNIPKPASLQATQQAHAPKAGSPKDAALSRFLKQPPKKLLDLTEEVTSKETVSEPPSAAKRRKVACASKRPEVQGPPTHEAPDEGEASGEATPAKQPSVTALLRGCTPSPTSAASPAAPGDLAGSLPHKGAKTQDGCDGVVFIGDGDVCQNDGAGTPPRPHADSRALPQGRDLSSAKQPKPSGKVPPTPKGVGNKIAAALGAGGGGGSCAQKAKPKRREAVEEELKPLWHRRCVPRVEKDLRPKPMWLSLRKWLLDWGSNKQKDSYRAALITGPAGCGKTLGARMVAEKVRGQILEYHLDDKAARGFLDQLARRQTTCEGSVAILRIPEDPIDSLSDRILNAIRATPMPVILVGGEQAIQLYGLTSNCLHLPIQLGFILTRTLQKVVECEGLKCAEKGCVAIAKAAAGDLRRAINAAQLLSVQPDYLVRGTLPPWSAVSHTGICEHLVADHKQAKGGSEGDGCARSGALEHRLRLMSMDEGGELPLELHRAYLREPRQQSDPRDVESLAVAAAALCAHDVVTSAAVGTAWASGLNTGGTADALLLPVCAVAQFSGDPERRDANHLVTVELCARFAAEMGLPKSWVVRQVLLWAQTCQILTVGRFKWWLRHRAAKCFGRSGQGKKLERREGEEEEEAAEQPEGEDDVEIVSCRKAAAEEEGGDEMEADRADVDAAQAREEAEEEDEVPDLD